jgi:hypothetical protein
VMMQRNADSQSWRYSVGLERLKFVSIRGRLSRDR